MKRAISVMAPQDSRLEELRSDGTGAKRLEITLSREERYRRRVKWQTDCGAPFLLDLAETTYLPAGAGLLTEDGTVIMVRAALEDLLMITAPSALQLSRIAWHLGNRHTPAEITQDAIYILPDHVLESMVLGLEGRVTKVARAFEPEGGAYGGHGSLEHGHHHGHGHAHDHGVHGHAAHHHNAHDHEHH